jgi:hypothetical protein
MKIAHSDNQAVNCLLVEEGTAQQIIIVIQQAIFHQWKEVLSRDPLLFLHNNQLSI